MTCNTLSKNEINVIDVKETTFLDDKAPCISAITTQSLLKANNIDFFGNDKWSVASPHLNNSENIGAILQQSVEISLEKSGRTLNDFIRTELGKFEFDTKLFSYLLLSYPDHLDVVRKVSGEHTKF